MDPDVQDENDANPAGQAIEHCLRNPVILRTIFRDISNHELVKLSVMNKLWNYEARSVMRKRGTLMACLRSSDDPPFQPDLAAFGADLRQMNVVPFTGISIKTDIGRDDPRAPTEAVDWMIDAICDHMPLKKVSIHLTDLRRSNRRTECPAMILGRKLLRRFSGTVEELSLNIPFNQVEFIEQAFQGCTLSSLKILKLTEAEEEHSLLSRLSFTEYMKALVSRAPNLEELHLEGDIRLTENVMKGSSAVLIYKPLKYTDYRANSANILRELQVEGTPLIFAGNFFNLETERFNRIYPVLLQDFRPERYERMWVDVVLAVRLMRYKICLENVRELNMSIKYELAQPRLLAILKNFDFTRIFPRLDKVTVYADVRQCNLFPPVDQVNTLIDEANTILGVPLPDRVANIKELILEGTLSNNTAAFYTQMFPITEKLHIRGTKDREIPFSFIWEYWVHLKELEVTVERDLVLNLDSVICGIFPEEVAELRQMDDEFLKRVNIVPIAPSITHLSNLRRFTFTFGKIYVTNHLPLPLLPSKVTGLLAFAKCPQLAVTLKSNRLQACQMMSDLEPYASVVHEA